MVFKQDELSEKLAVLKSLGKIKLADDIDGVLLKNGMLIANNLKTSIVVPLTTETDDEEFIIPTLAIDFISSLPSTTFDMECDDNSLTVKSGKIKCKFNTKPASNYPETNTNSPDINKKLFQVKTEDLEKAVKQIVFACGTEKCAKPEFAGVLFEGEEDMLNIVTCDGFRIAWKKWRVPGIKRFKLLIEREALMKALSVANEEILFCLNDKKSICIQAGDYEITTRLMNETAYADYKSVFPENYTTTFAVKRQVMLSCLNRLSICINNKMRHPAVLEHNESYLLRISSMDEQSDIDETIALDTDSDITENLRIGVNISYMKDALKAATDDVCTLKFSGALSPIVISDDGLEQMILPMRLKGAN